MEVHNESAGETSEDFALKLFSEIPKSLIHKLYKHYQYDFEMFGYDYKPYYRKGKFFWKARNKQNIILIKIGNCISRSLPT